MVKQKTDQPELSEVEQLQEELARLEEQLAHCKDREQRALADYQNLIRRTREDQSRFAKLATVEFVENLLQPLGHLQLAADQLNDQGLTMVITQLWQTLEQQGLSRIEVKGKRFDVETMEVVEKEEGDEEEQVVVKEVRPGYTLNEIVIQHAKVVLGKSH